jgi:hypothetical protein
MTLDQYIGIWDVLMENAYNGCNDIYAECMYSLLRSLDDWFVWEMK